MNLTNTTSGESIVKPELHGPPVAQPSPAAEQFANKGQSESTPPDATDSLDWDCQIETPPARPSQTVTLTFVEGGMRPIAIIDDMQD